MTYIPGNSAGGSYIGMPNAVNYSPHRSNSMSYTFRTSGDGYYDDSSALYSGGPSQAETKLSADEFEPVKVIVPKNEMITIDRGNRFPALDNMPSNMPIDRLIQEFMPQKLEFPSEMMPINEIEKAIDRIVKIEHFEMQEEIIIRRRVVRKSVVFGS